MKVFLYSVFEFIFGFPAMIAWGCIFIFPLMRAYSWLFHGQTMHYTALNFLTESHMQGAIDWISSIAPLGVQKITAWVLLWPIELTALLVAIPLSLLSSWAAKYVPRERSWKQW